MPDQAETLARKAFEAEGLRPHTWSNEAGFEYPVHTHDYHKVLFCVEGSIVFDTPEGEIPLEPGQRMDLSPGTPHSAKVGPSGVTCMEAKGR